MPTLDDENAKLRAELAAQANRIASLEAQLAPKPAPKPREPEGVSVRYFSPADPDMPNRAELRQLLELAFCEFPTWWPKDFLTRTEAYIDEFSRAMRFIGSRARTAEPNKKHYLSHWQDEAVDLCRQRGESTDIYGLLIAAACSAVPYQLSDHSGVVAAIGLADYGDAGIRSGDWRRILESGVLPRAFVPMTGASRNYEVRPIQVFQMGPGAQGQQYS